MKKNILKLLILCFVTVCSLKVSSYFVNDHVLEVEVKEKSIADALIKKQMQETLKEAEEEIEQAKKEDNLVVETEKVEMKPPVVEEKPKEEIEISDNANSNNTNSVDNTNVDNADENVENTIDGEDSEVSDVTENGDTEITEDTEDKIIVPGVGEFDELDEEAITQIETYLVDNYFLDGYVYAEIETDEKLKERKILVRDMEDYVVNSMIEMAKLLDILETLDFDSVIDVKTNVETYKTNFEENYGAVEKNGLQFEEIYDLTINYFDKCTFTLDKIVEMSDTINNSSNAFLAMTVALSMLDTDIMPAIKDIINSGIDLKEKTNIIYLEGVEGKKLLSREEVIEIINILQEVALN
ncbi:hypothetical protein JYG23_12110 [Sedimentibacter sp. zth1]|uniref:hypothetical protein n=1 Tax=Sedimentibacter sp. zth1 TaxID=2816908 RepID=UPI001A93A5B3|nr:hypothetical protein [Sedimentibacter sp. zth1]QSX05412.1 hypothetical protein JYG23_12110 [Sedimentibacter sp. zth1]